MKCDKCGNPIFDRLVRYNNLTLCENCAREMGIPDAMGLLGSTLKLFDSELGSMFSPQMNSLEFSPSRTQIKCPKCGTSLRDFETTGLLGCIECYNTFNESVMRTLMKTQANTQYKGRSPQIPSDNLENMTDMPSDNGASIKQNSDINAADSVKAETARIKNEADDSEKLEKYENSDFKKLTNDELKDAIRIAVSQENYMLAAKFRDELKGRGDNV